ILSFEAAFGMPLVLMALNRVSARSRLSAQQAYEEGVKSEEEVKSVMTHLEVQDEVMLQVLHRLERLDRELRKISRRLGGADAPGWGSARCDREPRGRWLWGRSPTAPRPRPPPRSGRRRRDSPPACPYPGRHPGSPAGPGERAGRPQGAPEASRPGRAEPGA